MSQITSYGSLSAAAPDDVLVVVDVDDTTMAPTGTTKKIQVQNLVDFAPSTAAYSASASAGGVLSVANTHSAPTGASVQFTAAAAGDKVLGVEVAGDTSNRFVSDSNGTLGWGNGTARDTTLQRAGGGGLTTTGPDGNTYDVGRMTLLSTGQTVTSTSAVVIAGLSTPVGAATYRVKAWILYAGSTSAGTANFSFNGPATSFTQAGWQFTNPASSPEGVNSGGMAFPGGTITSPGLITSPLLQLTIDAIVTFSASGTLQMTCWCGTPGDHVVISGGYLELLPVI